MAFSFRGGVTLWVPVAPEGLCSYRRAEPSPSHPWFSPALVFAPPGAPATPGPAAIGSWIVLAAAAVDDLWAEVRS
jgi:hypothetical protein